MRPSLEELLPYAGRYDLLPVYKKIDLGALTAVEVIRRLRRNSRKLFLLEHADRDSGGANALDRYSYIGSDPSLEVWSRENTLTVVSKDGTAVTREEDPRTYLRELIGKNRAPRLPELPPFSGGFAGYFSYEYISLTEPTCRFASANGEGYRDFDLMLFDRLYVIDREENCLYLICHIPSDRAEENYRRAKRLYDTCMNSRDLEQACALFKSCGDYLDAQSLAETCGRRLQKSQHGKTAKNILWFIVAVFFLIMVSLVFFGVIGACCLM